MSDAIRSTLFLVPVLVIVALNVIVVILVVVSCVVILIVFFFIFFSSLLLFLSVPRWIYTRIFFCPSLHRKRSIKVSPGQIESIKVRWSVSRSIHSSMGK